MTAARLAVSRNIRKVGTSCNKQATEISPTLDLDGGIALESIYDDVGRVKLSHSDLDDLQHHTVLCHYDLEPRSILVKRYYQT